MKSFRKAEQTEESLREKREEFLERGRAELYAGGKETPLDRRERYKKDLEDTKRELEEVKSDLKRVTGGDAKRELQEDQLAMFASEFGTNERHFCSWYVVCCLDVISPNGGHVWRWSTCFGDKIAESVIAQLYSFNSSTKDVFYQCGVTMRCEGV